MDNLTHSLVGLFLARSGFRYASERGTAIMVLAANAPDFDTVSWLGGTGAYLHWHRNITHSLIALPVMALLAVAIVRVLGRRPVHWLNAWLIAMVGVASHLILDLTNVYGVRLMLPFSGHWFHWDITPVVDLGIWTIVLLGVAAPALGRLVGSEIGEKHKTAGNAGWAFTALLLFAAYDYGRSILHDRAIAILDARTYNGLAARRVGAFPHENPLIWDGVAELSNAYVEAPVDLRGTFHASDEQTYVKPPRTPAIEAALRTRPFQLEVEWVEWALWIAEPGKVSLVDLRFGAPKDAIFPVTAILDSQNRVIESRFGL